MQNARLDELQAGIKIAERNINDTTLMAEIKEELKTLLIKGKGDWKKKSWLKTEPSKN